MPANKLPPPPKKVVVARPATLKPKDKKVSFERWPPYKVPECSICFNKKQERTELQKVNNVIFQWEVHMADLTQISYPFWGIYNWDHAKYEHIYGQSF